MPGPAQTVAVPPHFGGGVRSPAGQGRRAGSPGTSGHPFGVGVRGAQPAQTHLLFGELGAQGLGVQLHVADLLQPLAQPGQVGELGVQDLLELRGRGEETPQGGQEHRGGRSRTPPPPLVTAGTCCHDPARPFPAMPGSGDGGRERRSPAPRAPHLLPVAGAERGLLAVPGGHLLLQASQPQRQVLLGSAQAGGGLQGLPQTVHGVGAALAQDEVPHPQGLHLLLRQLGLLPCGSTAAGISAAAHGVPGDGDLPQRCLPPLATVPLSHLSPSSASPGPLSPAGAETQLPDTPGCRRTLSHRALTPRPLSIPRDAATPTATPRSRSRWQPHSAPRMPIARGARGAGTPSALGSLPPTSRPRSRRRQPTPLACHHLQHPLPALQGDVQLSQPPADLLAEGLGERLRWQPVPAVPQPSPWRPCRGGCRRPPEP